MRQRNGEKGDGPNNIHDCSGSIWNTEKQTKPAFRLFEKQPEHEISSGKARLNRMAGSIHFETSTNEPQHHDCKKRLFQQKRWPGATYSPEQQIQFLFKIRRHQPRRIQVPDCGRDKERCINRQSIHRELNFASFSLSPIIFRVLMTAKSLLAITAFIAIASVGADIFMLVILEHELTDLALLRIAGFGAFLVFYFTWRRS